MLLSSCEDLEYLKILILLLLCPFLNVCELRTDDIHQMNKNNYHLLFLLSITRLLVVLNLYDLDPKSITFYYIICKISLYI